MSTFSWPPSPPPPLHTLAELEQLIAQRDRLIDEKDRIIAGKDRLIAEKDLVVAEMARCIADLKNRLHGVQHAESEQKNDFSPFSKSPTNKSPATDGVAVFARDAEGKVKCQICPLEGDVRTKHVVSNAHLKKALWEDGTPKRYCLGDCKKNKPRGTEPIPLCPKTPPLGKLFTVDYIVEHRSVKVDDYNNVHCTVCGGAVQLAVPTDVDKLKSHLQQKKSQQTKKRKTTDRSSQSSASEFSSTEELRDD
jgi:hypothetical protein